MAGYILHRNDEHAYRAVVVVLLRGDALPRISRHSLIRFPLVDHKH